MNNTADSQAGFSDLEQGEDREVSLKLPRCASLGRRVTEPFQLKGGKYPYSMASCLEISAESFGTNCLLAFVFGCSGFNFLS